jgi:hypothetical protein
MRVSLGHMLSFSPKQDQRVVHQRKKAASMAEPEVAVPTNAFELLSDFIEQEPEYESSAAELWQIDDTTATKHADIADDSVADAVAMHAYVTELQNVVATVRDIWAAAASGELPLAVAGWLTCVAQPYLRQWVMRQHGGDMPHERLIENWLPKASAEDPDEKPLRKHDAVGSMQLSEGDEFQEFTHGFGLHWPYEELIKLREDVKANNESLTVVERRKLEDYFITPSQELALKQQFVMDTLDFFARSGNPTAKEDDGTGDDVVEKRYGADRALAQSLFRSVRQPPLYEAYVVHGKEEDALGREFLQRGFTVQLLEDMKMNETARYLTHTPMIVGVHFLLESCRTFLPGHRPGIQAPPNSRIRVLAVANTVQRAMKSLLKTETDAFKKGVFKGVARKMISHYMDQLDYFVSQKSFDLYTQSPWFAGSYMSEIVAHNVHIGLELLNAGGYLTHLLHLYNVLQQVRVPGSGVPVLDHLCDLLGPAIFQDAEERPTSNFMTRLQVSLGSSMPYKDRIYMRDLSKQTTAPFSGNTRVTMEALSSFASQVL